MKHHLLYPFIFIFAMSAVLSAADNTKDPHPKTLRVISYNTWYVFNHKKEVAAGKKWMKEQTPDIVALQELTGIKPALLQSFAESWGHKHSSLLKSSGFSVGLTSRYPIETVEKGLKNMHHGFLHLRSGGVEIFVVHLSPFKWEVRQREANILTSKIKPLVEAGEKVMILGDFNALSPADASILDKDKEGLEKALASDAKHGHVRNLKDGKFEFGVMQSFFDAGLIDTAKGKLPRTPLERISCPTGVFEDKRTASKKGKRIDYILTGPQLHKMVTQTSIPRKDELNRISDHYPVVVDFNITPK
jgi:exodeoxyribonuclease-3